MRLPACSVCNLAFQPNAVIWDCKECEEPRVVECTHCKSLIAFKRHDSKCMHKPGFITGSDDENWESKQ